MKKFILCLLCSYPLFSQSDVSRIYSNEITSKELKELLYVYASDYFGGREVGSKGQKIAVDFLREFYIRNSIDPAKGTDNYFQYIKNIKTRRYYLGKQFIRPGIFDSENVVSIKNEYFHGV